MKGLVPCRRFMRQRRCRLDWLDPADIARIDVLKDPAETSLFGGRGAHGVIMITTKRNEQRSPPR